MVGIGLDAEECGCERWKEGLACERAWNWVMDNDDDD
jgi:hypothetical protein